LVEKLDLRWGQQLVRGWVVGKAWVLVRAIEREEVVVMVGMLALMLVAATTGVVVDPGAGTSRVP
jgi:hypothetical protein